ncbi:MAG: hypothetical protein E6Q98_17285 [Rhodospirillaceae bacterium]|nr:MAG: hypothetical protein E6Q98_17285 [Rhodospirillaceae bacterium]
MLRHLCLGLYKRCADDRNFKSFTVKPSVIGRLRGIGASGNVMYLPSGRVRLLEISMIQAMSISRCRNDPNSLPRHVLKDDKVLKDKRIYFDRDRSGST